VREFRRREEGTTTTAEAHPIRIDETAIGTLHPECLLLEAIFTLERSTVKRSLIGPIGPIGPIDCALSTEYTGFVIELPAGVSIEEVPVEKKYRSSTSALMNRIRRLYEELYERFGTEGLDLIRDVSREFGSEIADRGREKIKGGDPKSVALYLVRIFDNVRGEGKVVDWGEERVVIRVNRCPYPFTKPEVCEAHTAMERVVVETLGDGLVYRIDRSIPKGDPFCDHVIEVVK
jgi:hypothetical protein